MSRLSFLCEASDCGLNYFTILFSSPRDLMRGVCRLSHESRAHEDTIPAQKQQSDPCELSSTLSVRLIERIIFPLFIHAGLIRQLTRERERKRALKAQKYCMNIGNLEVHSLCNTFGRPEPRTLVS